MSEHNAKPLVEAKALTVHFPVYQQGVMRKKIGEVKAVDGIDFTINSRETLGLVGESGCGKSTTGYAVLRLVEITGGQIFFEGRDITQLSSKEVKPIRRRMQIIYQDPFSSLNPRMTVGDAIGDPLKVHGLVHSKKDYRDQVAELLKVVKLEPDMADRYPHEFSGGQRQRIGVARSLAVKPSFIVCDEPVSALDVSIQAQIVNLLKEVQEEFNLTYLFIAHDLSVVRHISNRVAVMYLGEVVEITSKVDLYHNPLHPYTQALLSAIPVLNPKAEANRKVNLLPGEVPSPLNPPSGCRFHPRCSAAKKTCSQEKPVMKEVGEGHSVRCFLYE
jgi:oligopeptide transport system ATP-binding protein